MVIYELTWVSPIAIHLSGTEGVKFSEGAVDLSHVGANLIGR